MKVSKSIIALKCVIVCILSIFILGGCASTGAIYPIKPITVKLASYKTMLINVESEVPEASLELSQMEIKAITALKENALFEKVFLGSVYPDASADLELNLKIVDLNKVSHAARAMSGALAGRAKIIIEAELIDLKTRENISAFKIEGKSSAGSVTAGLTEQAVQRAVEQIVLFFENNM